MLLELRPELGSDLERQTAAENETYAFVDALPVLKVLGTAVCFPGGVSFDALAACLVGLPEARTPRVTRLLQLGLDVLDHTLRA